MTIRVPRDADAPNRTRTPAGNAAALADAGGQGPRAGFHVVRWTAKLLEVARGLLLDSKLMLIDEPSIGLSLLMVQEAFTILKGLRDKGVTIVLIEQNAKQALQMSDYGLVLEQGLTRCEGAAGSVLADERFARLILGGGLGNELANELGDEDVEKAG